ncbi:MAG: DNA polymerase I [Lachnospiraceae bacterium]|nr:DNA polymerase I [Lachnospiraceae bacterium]
MKEKLLLIDGHSIVNRAFYGVPATMTNSEGLHTNAIFGFLNIFFSAYTKIKPDYVIVAFDLPQKTFRHEMYEAYKGTRKGMPDELHEQVPVLKDVLRSMNIKTAELAGYEADDVLGTYAKTAEKEGLDVVVLSGDRDLLQLATDNIMIAIPKTKSGGTEIENYFAKDVKERYQVTPQEFIDLKALMGDSSDNIPGIPGIGEKTATSIIVQFGSLENAYAHVEEITPNRAKNNLKEFIEQGRMSRELAEINVNSPVEMDFHEARIENELVFYNDASYELYKKLDLKKLIGRFDMKEVQGSSEVGYEVFNASELPIVLDQLMGKENDVKGIGLYADDSLSLAALTFEEGNELRTKVFEGEIPDLRGFLTSGVSIYVFGLKNLLHSQYERYAEENPFLRWPEALDSKDFVSVYDIEIMSYLIDPSKSAYPYDVVLKDQTGELIPSKEELLGKLSVKETLSDDDKKSEAYKMAALSSYSAFHSFPKMKESLEQMNMWKLLTEMEMPLAISLFNMEIAGIRVEKDVLDSYSKELSASIAELEKEIYEEAGEEFNINSPKQLGVILFEKLKLPHGKKTKTGYSTSADVLEKLADEFPFANRILEYRQAAKLKSTYADGLVTFISEDGRIHGTFNQTITATGRISSTEPNLQNIPIRNELGQGIRKAFVASEGCVFLDADYSQIELRLLAHLSGDENLIEAYKSDADIHKITASKVFHTPLDEVTKEQRRNAKAVNFGIVYGISSFGLSQDLSISRKEAGEYIKQYFATYPKVKEFLDRTVKQAKMDGYTTTMFERRRPIPELASSNFMQRAFGERAAMNAPIQGSAADIMKIAMIHVEKALREAEVDARIVLQVHDELLVECAKEDVEKVRGILHDEMAKAADVKVPLEVEVDEGGNWFEAH